MRISDVIARTVTQRRTLVWCSVAVLALGCIAILVTQLRLDSDVLNILPASFRSVAGLKIYDREFEQTRQLTFALVCAPDDVEKLEEFAPLFADKLRQQPWCTRVLAGSPMQTPDGIRDLQSIAVPLLLNLEPDVFNETISILQPQKIRDRLHRLHQQIEAGSPRPELELAFDPLGLIAPALKPFAESTAIEEDQPLASSDRTMRVFLAVTNQESISAFACQRLMRQVNAFRANACEGWDGGPLEILVTGRSAYVAEISLSMRYDIVATLLGSAVLVGSIFFIGFRRWLPLLGMGFSLLLSCLVALTLGLLIFRQLSMVSVCFCALTTAVGFLALILSGSMGFSQLGVLIAIGIFFAGFFMCTVLFLFVRERQPPPRHDWVFEMVKKYVRWSVERPAPMLIFASALLLLLTVIGFSPVPPLHFEASTRSLEPKNSRASRALQAIMHKMPMRWEPVLAIVQASNPQDLHDDWQKISGHWSELQTAGKIKGFSTPAALCPSPRSMQRNREQLSEIDFQIARQTLDQTLDTEGFSRDAFAPAFTLLDNLQHLVDSNAPLPNWREKLPASSSWWFLVDRYFGHDPLLTTGFVTTNEPIFTHAQQSNLGRDLPVTGIPITLSGWSYALADLLPWSHRQLLIISALMAIFDVSLLALLYRDLRLWIIQVITLAFAIGAMIASMKLLHVDLNLLNVLSFRLVLAIGVDYGIYVVLVWQKTHEIEHDVAGVVKPVLLAGLTAVSGFGSLVLARNPSLSSLGSACAIGIFWSLVATIFFTLPAMAATEPESSNKDSGEMR